MPSEITAAARFDTTPGTRYHCGGAACRVLGVGKHARSRQELVIIQPEAMPEGQLLAMPLDAFALRYERVVEPAAEPAAEKVAGMPLERAGSGV